MSHQEKYAQLIAEQPKFHAQFGEQNKIIIKAVNHALSSPLLEWLMKNIQPGWRTVETGCGYSSVVFSIKGAEHTVISPFAEEHDAIKQWCAEHEVSTAKTRFMAKPSQLVMPGIALESGPLDLVLVDGDHSFPAPFIDWYYTADRVKKGGLMIVDDTQITTGTILMDFLKTEKGRWELETEIDKTAIFKKLTSDSVVKVEWHGLQPFCAKRNRSIPRRIVRKLAKTFTHPDDAMFWD